MAMTIDKTVVRYQDVAGLRKRVIVKLTGPSSYTSGGEQILPGDVGLGRIEFFPPVTLFKDSGDMLLGAYDYTNQKLVLYTTYTDQFSGDASTYSDRVEIVGY